MTDNNSGQQPCNHETLFDTGIGYYHCPNCNEGWTYDEWNKKVGKQPVKTKEEILSKLMGIPEYRLGDDSGEYPLKSAALKAMEEYASQFREGHQSAGVWSDVKKALVDWTVLYRKYANDNPEEDVLDDFTHDILKRLESFPVPSKEQGEERRMDLEKENVELKAEIERLKCNHF